MRGTEDIASAVILGTAAVLSVAGLVFLVERAAAAPSGLAVASVAVYGATLVAAYVVAGLYHAMRAGKAAPVLQALDHCAIFVQIAGTYTPFAVIALGDRLGWLLLVVVWGLALVGIAIRVLWVQRLYRLAPVLYLVQGWFGLAWAAPLLHTVGAGALALIVAGGVAYSGGIAFFVRRVFRYSNAVWHLFVVAGSACHYAAIAFYLLPYSAGAAGS